jgi:AraC-like DNA-binding protein
MRREARFYELVGAHVNRLPLAGRVVQQADGLADAIEVADACRVGPWSVRYDWKAGAYRHTTSQRFGHALLAPLVTNVFGVLGIPITLNRDNEWLPIHSVTPNIIRFETEHGLSHERDAYNARQLSRAQGERRAILAEHAGCSDLFVPVVARGEVLGVLVSGPFATRAPTTADILARWKWLTGRVGHPADPEFAWYLREALTMVVLDRKQTRALTRLLSCFAQLMSGQGSADQLANTCNLMRVELEQARFVERAWHAARTMLDERSPRSLFSETNALELKKLTVEREIDHVLVGLMVHRTESSSLVDEAIRRNAFQQSTTLLAKSIGGVLAGQVGDHGVVFLSGARGSSPRRKRKVHDLVHRASALARESFALELHFGAAPVANTTQLSPSYHAALAAAESALTQDKPLLFATDEAAAATSSLRELRAELGRVEEQPALLAARFERYLEAVSLHCGHRMESAIAHLEVGFEDVAASLLDAGLVEAKSFTSMRDALRRAAAGARSMNEVFAAYRRAFADVSEAVARPVPARRERSLQRAVEYIRRHFTDPLRIAEVARVAGFTRSHFSRLFIEREGMSYEEYVQRLRLERAQELLTSTELAVSRIAALSGFGSPQYFCRVFGRVVGMAPGEFRSAPQRAGRAWNQRARTNSPEYKRGKRGSR